MTDLTVIFFDYNLYHNNKVKVKKIISDYNLKWDNRKVKICLDNLHLVEAYKTFCIYDKISSDTNLTGRMCSVGMWSNDLFAVKIIAFEKDNDTEHLPTLLVIKGEENNEFYRSLITYCVGIGCTISKIVEIGSSGKYEEVFRRKLNVELMERLNTVSGNLELLELDFNSNYSRVFIDEWKRCIEKYGEYTLNNLTEEVKLLNHENSSHENDTVSKVKYKPKYLKIK
jgi:hypothetical protein